MRIKSLILLLLITTVTTVHARQGTFIDVTGAYQRLLGDGVSYNAYGGGFSVGHSWGTIGFFGGLDVTMYSVSLPSTAEMMGITITLPTISVSVTQLFVLAGFIADFNYFYLKAVSGYYSVTGGGAPFAGGGAGFKIPLGQKLSLLLGGDFRMLLTGEMGKFITVVGGIRINF